MLILQDKFHRRPLLIERILKIDHAEKRTILTPQKRDDSDRDAGRTKKTRRRGLSEIQTDLNLTQRISFRYHITRNRFLLTRHSPKDSNIDISILFRKREQLEAKRHKNPVRFVKWSILHEQFFVFHLSVRATSPEK